jgi:hypothetical protein
LTSFALLATFADSGYVDDRWKFQVLRPIKRNPSFKIARVAFASDAKYPIVELLAVFRFPAESSTTQYALNINGSKYSFHAPLFEMVGDDNVADHDGLQQKDSSVVHFQRKFFAEEDKLSPFAQIESSPFSDIMVSLVQYGSQGQNVTTG